MTTSHAAPAAAHTNNQTEAAADQFAAAGRFGTFTLSEYADLVRRLRERDYRFAPFPGARDLLVAGGPFVLMRHDIDMSLDAALDMARLEAELGVQATYFLMLRTDHYNVLSRHGTETVARILALGHHLGLHFDCDAYRPDLPAGELADACSREAAILGGWFDHPVDIVSYHRPNEWVLSGDPTISAPLPHTYMAEFRESIRYVSDSAGRWGHGSPATLPEFDQGRPLHILTHPVWWGEEPASAFQTLLQLVGEKTDALERSFAYNCKAFRVPA